VDRAIGFIARTGANHLLWGAFRDEKEGAAARHDHRHAPPLEIEGDFVSLREALGVLGGALEDGDVQGALHTGLERTVQSGQKTRALGIGAKRVGRTIEGHRASGQGARLVAAQDVDAPEVLDGRQVLDDHLLFRHASRTLRQRDRGDHREELRRQPDGECNGEQERLERIPPGADIHHED
jgi:hypothetical protein